MAEGDVTHLLHGLDVGSPPQWASALALSSSAFPGGGPLPDRCAADRGNVSPPLSWRGVPARAEELALVCHDADAGGGPPVHWLVTGIAVSVVGVAEGSDPASSITAVNSFGDRAWTGPCPPFGGRPHRYVFTLLAAAAPLGLGAHSTLADLIDALDRREVARGRLVGTFGR